MRKKLGMIVLVTLLGMSTLSVAAEESTTQYKLEENGSVMQHEISPFAYNIVWRYKIMNGRTYKRQYNKTTSTWIGNWILA